MFRYMINNGENLSIRSDCVNAVMMQALWKPLEHLSAAGMDSVLEN